MSEEQERSLETRVGAYLAVLVKTKGSDLFLHTGAKPTIKGPDGFKSLDVVLNPGEIESALRSMLSDTKMAQFEKLGDLDFSFSISGVGRFRGNAFRQRGDVSVVMRYVIGEIPTIDGLGLPEVLKSLVEQKNGMVVVAGATGSGKSTTLAAMIDHRNTHQAGHLITLEDPIEFMHKHKKSLVAQREIGTDTISFESGMRAAMREAPDVILLGEIRDLVTMDYAVRFANTGHLCLSTIHSNTAVSSLERMLGFYHLELQDQEAKRIAQNLKAIICQRLVPKVGGGKVAAIEIMVNTTRMTDLIASRDYIAIKEAIGQGKNYGMQTFDQAICQLYEDGIIDATNAVEYADSKTQVSQFIRFHSENAAGLEGSDDLKLEDIDNDKPTWGGRDTF